MNRKDLIARALAEDIPLTESKLRRYINLGLVVTEVKGRGRARGTSSYYTERTIDTLKEIHRLSHIKQEELIFTLYWKGYPVVWDKLKEALRVFVSSMETTFNDTFKAVSDPHNAQYAIEKIAEDSLPPKKPGRPSKEDEAEMEQIYLQGKKRAEGMLSFVVDLATQRMLTVDNMVSFFGLNEIILPSDKHALFGGLVNWTRLDHLFTAILRTTEQDFIETTDIIETLSWYWNVFANKLDESKQHPYFAQLLELVDKHYPGGFIAENTALIKYILLVILVLNQQLPIKDFLQSEQAKTAFSLICQQLDSLESSTIEGR